MSASSRGSRAASSIMRTRTGTTSSRPRRAQRPTCTICSAPSRSYSIAAISLNTLDSSPNPELHHIPPPVLSSTTKPYTTHAGLLLTRPPLLTPPQTSFEKAYFLYQKRLNERLAMPFTRYFYFKKDTPADADWKIKARERNGVAGRDVGGYRAYGEEGWNDELLVDGGVGDLGEERGLGKMGIAEPEFITEALVRDARVRAVEGKDGGAVEVEGEGKNDLLLERPLSRVTESDRLGDERMLDRRLERTLFLVVKREGGGWGFPAGELEGRENLHQAAERVLVQTAGINMNTWIVGRVPVGYHTNSPRFSESGALEKQGVRTFFIKGRIMAGQADITGNLFGLSNFKWLTKEEVKKHVASRYWSFVKNMMADR